MALIEQVGILPRPTGIRRRNVTTIAHPASDDPIRDERFRLGIEGSGVGIWDLDFLRMDCFGPIPPGSFLAFLKTFPSPTTCSFRCLSRKTANARIKPSGVRSKPVVFLTCNTVSTAGHDRTNGFAPLAASTG